MWWSPRQFPESQNFDQLADWLHDYIDMSRLAEIAGLPLS
jgi:hypothetical protein